MTFVMPTCTSSPGLSSCSQESAHNSKFCFYSAVTWKSLPSFRDSPYSLVLRTITNTHNLSMILSAAFQFSFFLHFMGLYYNYIISLLFLPLTTPMCQSFALKFIISFSLIVNMCVCVFQIIPILQVTSCLICIMLPVCFQV